MSAENFATVAKTLRTMALAATEPERKHDARHREAAKAFTHDVLDDAGHVVGRMSSYTYAHDEDEDREFREARRLATTLNCIADAFDPPTP